MAGGEWPGEVVPTPRGEVVINGGPGQTLGSLGGAFSAAAHNVDLFEHAHEVDGAERLSHEGYDVRTLEAAHDRQDGFGNPDVIIRGHNEDVGEYADLKRLDPSEPPTKKDPDYSRRLEKRLREPFSQDARIRVAVVDGREVGLTIDAAVRGIKRAVGFWRQQGREITPDMHMIVFTGDGTAVTWSGASGAINVSA